MRSCGKDRIVESAQPMEHDPKSNAFVFDADGVVIDPWGFANALSTEYGISRDETREFFAGPFKHCLTGNARLSDAVSPFLDRWKWPDTMQACIGCNSPTE